MILHISWEIWQRLREYVAASLPNEVTGIGAIEIINSQEVKVTDIFLPQQRVSAGHSQFAKGELGRIISNFVRNNPAYAGNLCFRWHSHAHGAVFWSTIDESDIDSWKGDYVFNLVTNAKGEVLTRLDIFNPFRITISDVKLKIDYPELDTELKQKYAEEVRAKVVPLPPKWPGLSKRLGPNTDDSEILQLLCGKGGLMDAD